MPIKVKAGTARITPEGHALTLAQKRKTSIYSLGSLSEAEINVMISRGVNTIGKLADSIRNCVDVGLSGQKLQQAQVLVEDYLA